MSLLANVYRLLRPVAHPVVDVALAEALPTAERTARRLIVLSLLERRNDGGLASLVNHYHLLGRQLQHTVLEHIALLDTPLRSASRDGDPQTRLNVIDLISQSVSFRLSYLLSAQLHFDDARVTRAAAAALRKLGESVSSLAPRRAGDDVAQRIKWLGVSLAEASACYHQHGRHDVLAAIAHLAPRRIAKLDEHLSDRRCAAQAALRDMIGHGERPEVNRAALYFAVLEPMRPAVTEMLSRPDAAARLPWLIPAAHLLAVPGVGHTLTKAAEAAHLCPTPATVAELDMPAQRLAPRWTQTLHIPADLRAAGLQPLTASQDAVTRLLALRALIQLRDPKADDAVAGLCTDADAAIARIALRHLIQRRWKGLDELSLRLVNSPHDEIRRMAERHLAPVGLARLWEQWDQMDITTRTAAGRALLKIDGDFHRQLAHRLREVDSRNRFKAVMIVRQLGQETHFEAELLQLLSDPSERVASAAAKALGAIHDSVAVAAPLQQALNHADDRVRANAVEALEELNQVGPAAEAIEHIARAGGHRSRAAAVKALFQLPANDAAAELERMLLDPDPRHRISALWVVEQLSFSTLARRVARVAQLDPDDAVRQRALRVLQLIAQALQEVST